MLKCGWTTVDNWPAAHWREAPIDTRQPYVYTVEQVRLMERAATRLGTAMDRVVIRTELRKLFGALRNDDAVWDRPGEWHTEGGFEVGCMYGTAYKTKATECTATRLGRGSKRGLLDHGGPHWRMHWQRKGLGSRHCCK